MIPLRLFAAVAAISTQAVSQEDPCRLLLQDGLYRVYNFTKTGNFSQDLRTYFLSETFRSDMRSNRWAGGLSVVIDLIPIGLNAGASDQEVTQFQQRIQSGTSVQLSQQFYDNASTRVPDAELAREYNRCLEISQPGFRITSGTGDRHVTFYVHYRGQVASDTMPKVTFLDVMGATDVRNAPPVGSTLRELTLITCTRNPKVDTVLIIETDRGGRTCTVPAEPSGFNADLPVGTVIASFLTWTEFQAVTKNNDLNPSNKSLWSSRYSKWAPADGREVPNSGFTRATNAAAVPDLRGRFIRGLNRLDGERPSIDAAAGDSAGERQRGSFQEDSIQDHVHIYAEWGWTVATGQGPYQDGLTANKGRKPEHPTTGVKDARQSAETRPRNVALYYYIRIN